MSDENENKDEDKNIHISKYLTDHYFQLEAPLYAVMLSGEWGCGKTFFMEKVMREYEKKLAEQEKEEKLMKSKKQTVFIERLLIISLLSIIISSLLLITDGLLFIGDLFHINNLLLIAGGLLFIGNLLKSIKYDTKQKKMAVKIQFRSRTEQEEKKIKQEKIDPFLYISLYGMKDTTEIDAEIFQKMLRPFFQEENTGSIIADVTLGTMRIIPFINDNVFNKDFSKAIKKMKRKFGKNKQNSKIMIFDDIERCHIPHQELFGYINSFVEHQKQKVVLLSHEEKLFESIEEEHAKKYKEKIIGATFKLKAKRDDAFMSFTELVDDEKTKSIFKEYKKLIFEIYDKIGANNLRSLRQAIVDFPHFLKQFPEGMTEFLEQRYDSLPHIYKGNITEFGHIICVYFFLFLKEKDGEMTKDNWIENINAFLYGSENKKSLFYYESHIIHDFNWYDMIILHKYLPSDSEELQSIFKKVQEQQERESTIFRNLQKALVESDSKKLKLQIQNEIKQCVSDIEKGKIKNARELLHSFEIIETFLSENDTIQDIDISSIIPTITDTIRNTYIHLPHENDSSQMNNLKSIIKESKDNATLDKFYSYFINDFNDYHFKKLCAMIKPEEEFFDIPVFAYITNQEHWEKVRGRNNKFIDDSLKSDYNESIQTHYNNAHTIDYHVTKNGKFTPMIRDMIYKIFYSIYHKISPQEIVNFTSALKIRYGMNQINEKMKDYLLEEQTFIKRAQEAITKLIKNTSDKILNQANQDLEKIQAKFKEAIDNNQQQTPTLSPS